MTRNLEIFIKETTLKIAFKFPSPVMLLKRIIDMKFN